MERDERFMGLAVAEARAAIAHGDVPIGAVLVRDGRVVAAAHNSPERDRDATAHAEMHVLRAATVEAGDWRLAGAELYVTLEPCPMCAGAIVAHRVSRLVFGAWNPKAGACGSLYNIVDDPRLNHRVDVRRGVLEAECAEQLSGFFADLRTP